jgi:osmotically-inducible protein OsmY
MNPDRFDECRGGSNMNTAMRNIVTAAALIVAASALEAQAADAAPSGTVDAERLTTDQRINDDVLMKLSDDQDLSGKIGVQTKDREVTLNGLVSTWGEAARAERDAQTVRGVTQVHNHINAEAGKNF